MISRRFARSVAVVSLLLVAAPAASIASENNPYIVGEADIFYQRSEGTDPNGLAMVADFLFARPLGLVATIVGGVVYVAALPFELMSQEVQSPARRLIAEPADFTFRRPLGCFNECYSSTVTVTTTETTTVVESAH